MAKTSKLDWQHLVGKEHVERGDAALAGRVVDGQNCCEPVVPAIPDGGAVFHATRRDDDALRVLRDGQERASVHVRGNDGLRYRQLQRGLVGQLVYTIRVDAAEIPAVEHTQVCERPARLGGPSDARAHVRADPVGDADVEVLEPVTGEVVAAADQIVGGSGPATPCTMRGSLVYPRRPRRRCRPRPGCSRPTDV